MTLTSAGDDAVHYKEMDEHWHYLRKEGSNSNWKYEDKRQGHSKKI
jgi:hypothetical protein